MTVDALTPEDVAVLSETRLAYAAQHRFEKSRLLCLAAGVLLDRGLRQYGLRERSVRIARSIYGKPYLPDHPQIHFSLSHSGERALAVFSGREIGCDVECIRPVNPAVAERRFTPEELARLRCSRQPEVDFFRLWTCKESFLKALGTGLQTPLGAFTVRLRQDAGAELVQTLHPSRWTLTEFTRPGCRIAVCEEAAPNSKHP